MIADDSEEENQNKKKKVDDLLERLRKEENNKQEQSNEDLEERKDEQSEIHPTNEQKSGWPIVNNIREPDDVSDDESKRLINESTSMKNIL